MIFVFFGLLQQISCAEPIFERTTIFKSGMYGTKFYRIPAIAHMRDRSMLLVVDNRFDHNADLPQKIGVYARIRYENATLTDPFFISGVVRPVGDGDAALVVDRKTGIVFCLWSGERGFWGSQMSSQSNPERVYFSKSYDNGVTWETKVDITHYIYSNLCFQCDDDERKKWLALFVTSGGGIQTRDGTIMFACLVKYTASEGHKTRNFILFTDDLGKSWNMKLGWPVSGADEAKLVQMNNGTVLMSIRQRGQRKFAWTNDKGDSWYRAIPMPDVKDPNCNGEIKRYTSVIDGFDKDRMLHSIAYNPSQRQNVSLMISYDEGFTWPIKKVIESGGSAYSAIDIDSEGNIFVFFEANDESGSGYKNDLVKVNLEWLTDGADTYKKPQLLNWCLSSNKEDSNCPEKSYIFNEKVFDGYVESYILYPVEVRYTFLEAFRDFTVNLAYEGLNTGYYENKYSNKFKIDFIGTRKPGSNPRSFTFKNIDVAFPMSEIFDIELTIENSEITIKDVPDCVITIGNNQVIFTNTDGKTKTLNIPSNCKIIIENTGAITLNSTSTNLRRAKLMAEGFVTIKPMGKFTKVRIEGEWEQSIAELIIFSSNSENKTEIAIDKANLDKFNTGDASVDVKNDCPTLPPTPVPPTTLPPTSVPSTTVPPTTVPPTTVPPTTVPSTTVPPTTLPSTTVPPTPISPTQIPISSSIVPTEPITQTTDPDQSGGSAGGTTTIIAGAGGAAGGLVVGIFLGCVIMYFVHRKKENKIDGSEIGVAFQSFQ